MILNLLRWCLVEDLFDLSLYLYGYYKIAIDKKCINRVLTSFRLIYEYAGYEIDNCSAVLR